MTISKMEDIEDKDKNNKIIFDSNIRGGSNH